MHSKQFAIPGGAQELHWDCLVPLLFSATLSAVSSSKYGDNTMFMP
jgi:hypothetical protein